MLAEERSAMPEATQGAVYVVTKVENKGWRQWDDPKHHSV